MRRRLPEPAAASGPGAWKCLRPLPAVRVAAATAYPLTGTSRKSTVDPSNGILRRGVGIMTRKLWWLPVTGLTLICLAGPSAAGDGQGIGWDYKIFSGAAC